MLFFTIPYDIEAVVKNESSLTGKSVRQIVLDKLRGETIEKSFYPELRKNLLKLEEIKALKRNWNGNKAKPIPKKIVNKTKTLIINLDKQPQIFPTANDSIQIEYDGENNSYLEVQVTKSNIISYYEIDKYENKTTGTIPFSSLVLNDLVKDFYNNNSFHEEKILLSNTDRELVMASLENPPEPNEALKELFINN